MSSIVPPLFPQTNPSDFVKRSRAYWRLYGQMETSGDIIECDVSSQSVVVGADSDISKYELQYLDIQAATRALTTSVSVRKPFLSRLSALNDEQYPTGDQGRILVSTLDLLPPPDYRPEQASPTAPIEIIQPVMDLYFFFEDEPSIIAPRSDKIFQTDQLAAIANLQGAWLLVPYYGRRTAQVSVKLLGFPASVPVTANVYGINFSPTIADPTATKLSTGHVEILLGSFTLPNPPIGEGIANSVNINNEFYDYLALEIEPTSLPDPESLAVHIVMSDS